MGGGEAARHVRPLSMGADYSLPAKRVLVLASSLRVVGGLVLSAGCSGQGLDALAGREWTSLPRV